MNTFKKYSSRKIVNLLLCTTLSVVLVVGFLPFTAFADNGTNISKNQRVIDDKNIEPNKDMVPSDSSTAIQPSKTESKTVDNEPVVAQKELLPVDKSIQNKIPEGNYYISTSYSIRKVLDVYGGSSADCANIEIWQSHRGNAQKFRIKYDENGYATIFNINGKALDVNRSLAQSGANVIQYSNSNTANQKWILSEDEKGIKIKSALSVEGKPDLCLDVAGSSNRNGANISIYNNTNNANQRFYFFSIDSLKLEGEKLIDDGCYSIKMKANPNKCFDVAGNSSADGANVDIWDSHGGQNQLFYFMYEESTKCYLIYNINSGKVLNAEGGDPIPEGNIEQWSNVNCDNEKWALSKREDGTIKFTNRKTGLVIDVCRGSTANGANVQCYTSHDGISQQFLIEKVQLFNDGIYCVRSKVISDRYVEVPGSSWNENTQLVIYPYAGGVNQKYAIKNVGDDTYTLRSVVSGLLIAQNNSNKVVQTSTNNDYAKWKIAWTVRGFVLENVATKLYMDIFGSSGQINTPVIVNTKASTNSQAFSIYKTDIVTGGTYTLSPACALGNTLNLSGSSWNATAPIISWPNQNTNNTKWVIEKMPSNYYRIYSSFTEFTVDVRGGLCRNNDPIQQYWWNGGAHQLWRIEFTDDGWFNFVNIKTGRLLDVFNSSPAAGATVGVYDRTGGNGQKWRLKSTSSASISGDANLDSRLKDICRNHPSMASAFNYVVGFGYRSGDLWPQGNWTIPYAWEMIQYGSGNCYRYAALFMWLARAFGYSANARCGSVLTVSGGRNPHGWVEVYQGGTTYVCDPELQHELGSSRNCYMVTYANAPVTYIL